MRREAPNEKQKQFSVPLKSRKQPSNDNRWSADWQIIYQIYCFFSVNEFIRKKKIIISIAICLFYSLYAWSKVASWSPHSWSIQWKTYEPNGLIEWIEMTQEWNEFSWILQTWLNYNIITPKKLWYFMLRTVNICVKTSC